MEIIKKNIFPISLITVIAVLNIISFMLTDNVNFLGIASSITGVICVVMTAKGHISCYFFGLINIISYIIIAFGASLYGEVMLNCLYYLPMQFIGFYLWKKNSSKKKKIVKAQKMVKKEMLIWLLIIIIGIIGYGYILNSLNGNQPIIDSTTTILSVVAMLLSVRRFKQQWLLWVVVDVVSIYMWAVSLLSGGANSLVIVIMWAGYLVNAIYGYYNWNKLEQKNV